MATIIITEFENERDLLPMICAKCGAAADVRVPRPVRFVAGPWSWLHNIGIVTGLLFFPPLFLFVAFGFGRKQVVRIPMCSGHQHDWRWRDAVAFRLLLPAWVLFDLAGLVVGLLALINGLQHLAMVCFSVGIVGLGIVLAAENLLIHRRAVKILKEESKHEFRLRNVHSDFVAALVEDRARAAVDDPRRRVARYQDLRDDYDEEGM